MPKSQCIDGYSAGLVEFRRALYLGPNPHAPDFTIEQRHLCDECQASGLAPDDWHECEDYDEGGTG